MKQIFIFTLAMTMGLSLTFAGSATAAKKKTARGVSSESSCSCERDSYAAAYKEVIDEMVLNLSQNLDGLKLLTAGCSGKKGSDNVHNTVSIGVETKGGLTNRQYTVDAIESPDSGCSVQKITKYNESR